MPTVTVLSTRALNRAFLERQLLTRRHPWSAQRVVAHLAGMQAQAPHPPYTGLWTRIADFDPQELSGLLTGRQVVRVALMRGTVHLVTAEDCLAWRPVVQPLFDVDVRRSPTHGLGDSRVDVPAVVAAGRALMEEGPLTAARLGAALAERFPGESPKALAHVLRALAPLVQVPPRGLWGRSGASACTTAEHWLGRPLAAVADPEAMVLRYLAAFGPASVRDVRAWSGVASAGVALEGLRGRLRVFHDAGGRELFDVPDGPLPGEDAVVPVRFLPAFDNALLSHADRSRIISDEDRRRVFTVNGIIRPTFLVDGFVAGMWEVKASRAEAALTMTPFRPLGAADREALVAEGERLLAFTAGPKARVEVRFAQ